MADVKAYKEKALPANPSPNSLYWIKADNDTVISGYITDQQGVPYSLKDATGGGGNANLVQFVIDGDTTHAPSGDAVFDFVKSQIGILTREEFDYVGSQTFTTFTKFAQVYSVEVRGVGALSSSQYTLTQPNIITINDPLEAGDFVVVLYSSADVAVQVSYTQVETDALLALKEDKVNKQDNLDYDGTGIKYTTVDAVNDTLLSDAKVFYGTGVTSKRDNFELEVYDVNTVRIKAVDGAIFYEELFGVNATTEDAKRTFPEILYSLSELVTPTGGNVNTNPIVADGIYVRYIGYDKDGNVISSENNFVENSFIAQLGLLTVIKTGGVISFLGGVTPGARNVFSIPILASTSDLIRTSTPSTTDVTVGYNIGTPTLYSNAGIITGLSINWRGLVNPNNTSSIDKFTYAGDNIVDFVSITPLFLTMSTPPVLHTLWTDVQDGAAINESFYNTTTSLRDTLDVGSFGIKRVLIGLKGGIFIQEPEFATSVGYTSMDEATANAYVHEFTDSIIPPDIVIEIARIVYKQGVTDFSNSAEFYIMSTAAGVGAGGGTPAVVGDATTTAKGIVQLAGDLSGTALLPTVPGLALKADDTDVIHTTGDEVKTGDLTVDAIIKAGGTSSQFLKADGSVDSSTYQTSLGYTAADDSLVLHKAGAETFTGTKSFTVAAINTPALNISNGIAGASKGIAISNTSSGYSIHLTSTGSGTGLYSENLNTGNGGYFVNTSLGTALQVVQSSGSGLGLYVNNLYSAVGMRINNATAATGIPFQYTKNSVEKAFLNDAGEFSAQKIIKAGGTSAQFLKADGSVDSTVYASAGNYMTLDTSQTFTSPKTFAMTNGGSYPGIAGITLSNGYNYTGALVINNTANGYGGNFSNSGLGSALNITNSGLTSGTGINITNSNTGTGALITNTGNGTGVEIYNNVGGSTAIGLKLRNATAFTGKPFQYLKVSTELAFLNDAGEFSAQKIIKEGGTSAQFLMADGSVSVASGGSGANLTYIASPTNGIVTSDTGTDATISLVTGTDAGLLSPTDYTAFLAKQNAITLTTTGSSGAATLIGSTLNIPIYGGGGGTITGSGTADKITKWSGTTAITDSTITDTGSAITLGVNTTVTGSMTATTIVKSGGTAAQFLKANGTVDSAVYATDSLAMHLAGNETFTGTKSFTVAVINAPAINISNPIAGASSRGFQLTNSNTGQGIYINNASTGQGIYVDNINAGTGAYFVNSDGGNGVRVDNTAAGDGYLMNNSTTGIGMRLNNLTGATGKPFQYTKNNVERAFINDAGQFSAQAIIKSGGVVTEFLKADGSVDTNSYALASTAHNPVTIGTANGLSLATQVLSLALASTSTTGALSSTDWNTFNNKTSNLGTVTSVAALTLGTTGTDLNSSVATSTTTPVITLNVPTASASNRGALSAADWTTFNNKLSAEVDTLQTVTTRGATTTTSITANSFIKTGGTSAQFLMADGSVTTSSSSGIATNVQAGTSYTILEADKGVQIVMTNAGANTVFVPTGLSTGFYCEVLQLGTGQTTITGTGTTLRYSTFESPTTAEQYSLVGIDKIDSLTNEYHIYGQLTSI